MRSEPSHGGGRIVRPLHHIPSKVADELRKDAAAKDAEIQKLQAKLDAGDVARKLAITEAVSEVEKERNQGG